MSRYRYVFASDRVNTIIKASKKFDDPQLIGEALEAVREKYGGVLRTKDALTEANHRDNYLNRGLEWDDRKAGHSHRMDQMRKIIQSIRRIEVGLPRGREEIPAFVSIRRPDHETAYYRMDDVLRSRGLTRRMLENAEGEALAFQRRYSRFTEIVAAADEILKAIRSLIEREDQDA